MHYACTCVCVCINHKRSFSFLLIETKNWGENKSPFGDCASSQIGRYICC